MSKKKKEWKAEKARLLSLGQEERRKEYGDYMALDKIPTWRNHHGREPEEEEIFVSLCDKVSLYKGDITILEVDAIVNAANASLLGGGGVDGCIHRAAGHHLYEECHSLNGCDTGKAKITCGYELPAKYVIHTVGPIARGNVGQVQKDDLASCYKNSLKLVEEHNLHSVAFPCISTGIYGFPNEPAANIALDTVRNWLKENKNKIDRIIFCVFLEHDYQIYNRKMSDYFPTDNEECEEGDAAAHADDDANKNDPDDVHMDSQADSDVDMQSQRDMDPEPPNTPSQPAGIIISAPETCTSAAETPANEMTSEQRDPVEDKNSAEDSKPKQKNEEDEEKKDDLEEADDIAGGEKEKGAGEKAENAPAETKPEEEEAQVTSMNSKDTDSQGLVETMELEGAENEDQIKTTDNSKSEGEAKHQDKCLAGTNQASQSDSSQSKDGPSDKGEPSKE